MPRKADLDTNSDLAADIGRKTGAEAYLWPEHFIILRGRDFGIILDTLGTYLQSNETGHQPFPLP